MSAAPGQAAQLQAVPAVLRHYEQLRRAIDALLQENDALKKVAALLRENQQIRNYLQTHVHGDLSAISNFIPLASSTVPNASGIVPGLAAAPNVALNDGQGSGSWNTTLSDATLGLIRGGLINTGETLTSAVNQLSQQTGAGSQLSGSRGQSSQAHSRGAEPVVRTSTPPTQVFTFGPAELSGFQDLTYPDTVFQSANFMENILNNTSALGAAAPRPGAAPTSGSVLGSTPIIGAGLMTPPGAVGGAIALPGPSLAQATARPLADTQRPPDVRPKERAHRAPRTTERPMSVRDSIQPGLGPRGDVEKGEPPSGPASADAAGLSPPAASAPHKSAPAPSSWPPPHQPAMVLRESPFPNRVLGGLYGLAQGLLYPSFWAANCLLDLKETTVEQEQHRLQRCPPYALQATAKGLALVLLFVFSLPVALLGLVLWLPLQAARRPFAYQHTMPTEPWRGWELQSRDQAFSFVTANVCLLPDGLAKFSNLGQTRQRAAILAKRLTSPASSYGATHHNPQVPGARGHRDKPEGRITASLPPELDFLCLQEVFDGQAAAVLRRQLGARFEHILYDVGVYGFYRGCNFKVLNSGLFLASRYPVLDVQYHCYPNSTAEDALAAKGMLSVQVLLGMAQGKRIVGYISCTHLFAPADGAQIRSEQLTLGLRWIQQFQEMQAQPGDLVAFDVLCGDLNFDNCSTGDKVEQTHALFHWYQDPCRLAPRKDKAWAIGTLLRYLKIHDEAVSTPENLESTLEQREGQHEYLEPPILPNGRPDPAAEKMDWRGRRIDYILHRAQPGPGPLSLHSEVETVSFITRLAGCSDHMALGLRLSVSPAQQ